MTITIPDWLFQAVQVTGYLWGLATLGMIAWLVIIALGLDRWRW